MYFVTLWETNHRKSQQLWEWGADGLGRVGAQLCSVTGRKSHWKWGRCWSMLSQRANREYICAGTWVCLAFEAQEAAANQSNGPSETGLSGCSSLTGTAVTPRASGKHHRGFDSLYWLQGRKCGVSHCGMGFIGGEHPFGLEKRCFNFGLRLFGLDSDSRAGGCFLAIEKNDKTRKAIRSNTCKCPWNTPWRHIRGKKGSPVLGSEVWLSFPSVTQSFGSHLGAVWHCIQWGACSCCSGEKEIKKIELP